MKRVFSVLAVVVLVAALAVPVMAAEVYEMPLYQRSLYPDFTYSDIFGEDACLFGLTEEFLPEGDYAMQLFIQGAWYDMGLVSLSYTYDEEDQAYYQEFQFNPFREVAGIPFVGYMIFCSLNYEGVALSCFTLYYNDDGALGTFEWSDDTILRITSVAPSTFDVTLASVDSLGQLLGLVLDIILNNWFLGALLCLSLIGLGAVAVKKLKRAK